MELNDPPKPGDDAYSEPVFDPASAPDHGPGFWQSLNAEIHADIVAANTVVPGVEVQPALTGILAEVPGDAAAPAHAGAAALDRTEQLATVSPLATERESGRRWQVLAAAAALLFVGLIGFGMLRDTGTNTGELVSSGDLAPAAGDVSFADDSASSDEESTGAGQADAAPTVTAVPAATSAAAPASQPDRDGTTSIDSSDERFLVQNDQQLLFFAETIPTGATNCSYADQNVLTVRAPDGSNSTLAGRIYPRIDEMVVNGELFALVTSNCDGEQMLEVGTMDGDGRLVSSRTLRGRVSDGSPAIFQGINLDASTGSVSFEDAAAGTTNFSPQLVEIDPPLEPAPTPDPTATPKPLPTLPPESTFAERARLIGSSADGELDWFTITDPSASCADRDYAQIMVIAGDGPANNVHSPQFTYSGDIGFFVASDDASRVAFVTTCGSQLELHVAGVGIAGTFYTSQLAWVGVGSPDNALVVWDDADTVALNGLQQDGTPFFVQYGVLEQRIVDSNIPALGVGDGGTPAGMQSSPLGATADGRLVYYSAYAADGSSGCEGEPATTVWVQGPTGEWAEAVADGQARGVSRFVIDDSSAQVAFSSTCEGIGGTLRIGLIQADGKILLQRTISMEPYVPGFISNLFWLDSGRVRIETNNASFAVDEKRFEYDLRADVMVQLDR